VEHPRKRSNTFSSTVDHLSSFWEGKNDKKEKHKEKAGEKHVLDDSSINSRTASNPIGTTGKEPVRLNEREGRKGVKEHKEKDNHKGKESSRRKEANTMISNDVLEAVKGLKEIHAKNSPQAPLTTGSLPYKPISTSQELHKVGKQGRVKHKAKSEGSLLSLIFSRKLERGALMQKSSSLIEMKQMIDATSKSGSALQLGKKQGYFGVTLHEAMEMQKEKFPNLLIPVIMPKLTEAILLFGGRQAEGIFRVAGSTQQIQRVQQQLNDMNFDDLSGDPHVLVGLLKQWLRELKEPLIPNSIYSECLLCETPTACLQVIHKMPELNKAALAHFVTFLRELSQPENLPFTKMDVHNLCLVSAPVLFRCPSTDMAELVVNMQKEKFFLGLVLESPAFK
jgi:hypothetical protein